jgi:hypothetical protein
VDLNPDHSFKRMNDYRECSAFTRGGMHDGVCRYLAGQKDYLISDGTTVDGLADEGPHVPYLVPGAEEHAHARPGDRDRVHWITSPAVP